MTYVFTPPVDQAEGEVGRLYAADLERHGYVPNYTQVFAVRPSVMDAWAQLNGSIRSGMDLRRYELVTLAAARRLGSTYCSLAHGTVLRDRFFDPLTVAAIARDHHGAGLDPLEVAVMDYADRVAGDPTGITATDVGALREHGLSDGDIVDVALAAAARCFFSTVLDAVGAEPDAHYRMHLEPELHSALTAAASGPRVRG